MATQGEGRNPDSPVSPSFPIAVFPGTYRLLGDKIIHLGFCRTEQFTVDIQREVGG